MSVYEFAADVGGSAAGPGKLREGVESVVSFGVVDDSIVSYRGNPLSSINLSSELLLNISCFYIISYSWYLGTVPIWEGAFAALPLIKTGHSTTSPSRPTTLVPTSSSSSRLVVVVVLLIVLYSI